MKALSPFEQADASAAPSHTQSPPRAQRETSVDLGEIFAVLLRRWWVIALLGAAGATAGLVVARATPPRYVAEAQLMLETRKQNILATEEVVPGLSLDDRAMASEVAVMRSRGLVDDALQRVDLTGKLGFDAELTRPSLPRRAVNALLGALGLGAAPVEAAQPPRSAVIDAALANLAITQDGISYVMTARFTTRDPDLSATFLNALIDAYVGGQSDLRRKATRSAASFLADRVEQLRQAVREADAEVVRQREGLLAFGDGGVESAIAQSEAAGADAAEARNERIALEAEVGQAEEARRSAAQGASLARFLEPQLFAEFSQRRAEAARARDAASASVGPRHPRVLEAQAEMAAIDAAIDKAVADRLSRLRDDLERARRREMLALTNAEDAEQRVVALRRAGISLAQTESEADVARNVYESIMLRLNDVRAQEAMSRPDARILSRAEPPRGPSWPRPGLFLFAGGFAGACFGAAFALFREISRRPYQNAEEIEGELGLRVLARLPRVRARNPSQLLAYLRATPHSSYAERLRELRAVVSGARHDGGFVITFCSALRGEGKTATALAFAQICGAAGLRTVLIDADLRAPALSRALGFGDVAQNDLVELIDGNDDVQPRPALPNVDFIPSRRNATSRVERLGALSLDALFIRLRNTYDIILIDTPPLLAVSDAASIARRSDLAALVIAERRTPRRLAAKAAGMLLALRAPNVATVLTMGADRDRGYAYGVADVWTNGAPR